MYHKDAKTKIVATIGPASQDPIKLKALIRHGVDIFRLNFKHNTVDWHVNLIHQIRNLKTMFNGLSQMPAIMLDLQGPSIRLVLSVNSIIVKSSKPLEAVNGKPQHPNQIGFTYPNLPKYLQTGDTIFADDGKFRFTVEKQGLKTYLIPHDTGELITKKSVNLPGIYNRLDLPPLTERDLQGLKVALLEQVELIAISFVRSAQDILYVHKKIKEIKQTLGLDTHPFVPQIVSKIETIEAVENIQEITVASDIIMVARGDLAIEAGFYKLPYYQSKIVQVANSFNKPVIIATQMLKSMTQNYLPTRAEITDVGHAVENRADAIMFSEETAMGKHPTRVVEVAQKILHYTEKQFEEIEPIQINILDYTQSPTGVNQKFNIDPKLLHQLKNIPDFQSAIFDLSTSAYHLYLKNAEKTKAFIVFSKTGKKATYLSKYKPSIPIIAFVPNYRIYGLLKLAYNVFPVVYQQADYRNITQQNIDYAISYLQKNTNLIKPNTNVILIYTKQLNKYSYPRVLEIIPIQ